MEKCKNATGQRLKIEMYVSANQRLNSQATRSFIAGRPVE